MRYGRQRWKLKGKIEVNSRQSWDGEEMVFMPLITDLINIKVPAHQETAAHHQTAHLQTAMDRSLSSNVIVLKS